MILVSMLVLFINDAVLSSDIFCLNAYLFLVLPKLRREYNIITTTTYKDWDKSGKIGQSEFLHLLIRINVYIKKELAYKLFSEAAAATSQQSTLPTSPQSRNKPPEITFNQCIDLLRKIKREQFNGTDVRDSIFDSVFGADKDQVTAEDFMTKFLHDRQKELDTTLEDVKCLFSELNRMEILRAHHEDTQHHCHDTIDRLLFEEYLMSTQNDAYDPRRREFNSLSLNEPISHYWINTSHNTYLVKR